MTSSPVNITLLTYTYPPFPLTYLLQNAYLFVLFQLFEIMGYL